MKMTMQQISRLPCTILRDRKIAEATAERDAKYDALCASADVPSGTDAGLIYIARLSRPIFDADRSAYAAAYTEWRAALRTLGIDDPTPFGVAERKNRR